MGTIVKNEKLTDRTDQSGVDYTKYNLGTRTNDLDTGKPKVDTVALTEGGIATVPLNPSSFAAND